MKRHNKTESAALWKWLETRPDKWWKKGKPFDSQFGWPQIYEADNWHCIYCGKDLAANEEVFAESTKDHLVPQSLFSLSKLNANYEFNVAICCSACNELKSSFMPEIGKPPWSSRQAYVNAMRELITSERLKRAKEYRDRAFKALARRIWSDKNVRQNDYLG